MRIFKLLLPFAAGLAVFLALNTALCFLMIPYQFTRVKIHRAETETFDDLILGSSHGSAAIDPSVLTEVTGRSCLNAAAGGQYPRDNYYLLLDACREHKPGRVIFEFDPTYWVSEDNFNRTPRYQLSMMEPSLTKLQYFMDLCLPGDIRYCLMPWFLYQTKPEEMRRIAGRKLGEAYRTYSVEPFSEGDQVCEESGFIAISDQANGDRSVREFSFGEGTGSYVKENQARFEQLVRCCREQAIELVVVTTPVPLPTRSANEAFYREAHGLMQALSEKYGFRYLDYVMPEEDASEHLKARWRAKSFSDAEGHMRVSAARRFSRMLARAL